MANFVGLQCFASIITPNGTEKVGRTPRMLSKHGRMKLDEQVRPSVYYSQPGGKAETKQ